MPRFFLPNTPIHVIVRGNNRSAIFSSEDDRAFMHRCLRRAAHVYDVAVHAYVFMTNHVHLLATPSDASSLPRTVQAVGRSYVRWYNDRYLRTGTLWEGRYRSAIVDSERYLLTCMRYIEQNPVRAGMVDHASAFRWSSFACNALGAPDPLVAHHPVYLALSSDPDARAKAYRDVVGVAVPEGEVHRIRDASQYGWALGGDAFRAHVSSIDRRAERRRLGRPPGAKLSQKVDSDPT